MATRRTDKADKNSMQRRPATTPEARENQVIADAYGLAERQIRDGTASAQVITHFLKLGSSREKLEQERLRVENELTRMKQEAYASAARVEELYTTALNAMRSYSGQEPLAVENLDDDYDED